MPVTTRVQLKDPVHHGSEVIETLEIRAPLMGDMRKFPANPNIGDLLDIAGELANQPPSVMNKLTVADGMEVIAVIDGFLPGSLPTGGK